MIRPIKTLDEIRAFMNAVPYPEFVPEDIPLPSDQAMVLGVYDPDLKGCFPLNIEPDRVQIHACFPRQSCGVQAVRAAKEAFVWIFDNLPQSTIYAKPINLCARIFARTCGMEKVNQQYEVTRWADS